MNDQVHTILKDLYQVDKSLREHEQELIKIIKELLASRPDTKLDKQFIRVLRAEILERAAELKPATVKSSNFFADFFSAPKLAYAMGGAAIAILLVIPVFNYISKPGALVLEEGTRQKQGLDFENKIAKLDSNAFGALGGSNLAQPQAMEAAEGRGASEQFGGGGGMSTFSAETTVSSRNTGLIAPEIINYNYVYSGDALSTPDEQMEVYKKVRDNNAGKDLAKGLSGFDFGLIDLDKFKNIGVSSFHFTEDRDFGYSVQFDLVNNSVSLNANWEKWPRPEAECRNQACYDKFRLKISDMPADDKIIAIADKFLESYNIDISNYGSGEVNDYWRRNYELAADKSMAYVPDTISVVYPLIVNGQKLYDEGGGLSGINVSVNVRHNKENNLYNITALNLVSSKYKTETDMANIIKIAENGGLMRTYIYPDASKTIDIELGTPTIELIRYHRPGMEKGIELYAPAYIFPVLSPPKDQIYHQQNIVVPAIKEILEERDNIQDGSIPMPRPMPLIDVGVDEEEGEAKAEEPVQE